jgi:long-chain acyl-CoA synthetase
MFMQTVVDMFYHTLSEYSDRPAVIHGSVKLSWEDMARRAERLACALRNSGLEPGQCVALYSENDFRFFEIAVGTAMAGGVLVPVNAKLSVPEVAKIVQSTDPVVLLCEEGFISNVKAVQKIVPSLEQVQVFKEGAEAGDYEGWLKACTAETVKTAPVSETDTAAVIFTSGTTGTPKGVMWSHQGILDFSSRWPLPGSSAGQRQLIFVPIYVGAGGMLLYNSIDLGTQAHLIRYDPQRALETIERERIQYVCGVTSLYQFMADVPGAHRYDLSSLELLVYGAQYMGLNQYESLSKFFRCDFKQVFGMTECPQGAALNPEFHQPEKALAHPERLRSAGRQVDGTDMRVVHQNGQSVASDGREVGEIIIKAKSLMKGYWKQPEMTANCIRDGFYWTNDMACVDGDGFIYIQDRKDYMIKSGGMNIFPAEVEEVIMRHPAVGEVAVIGVPHPKWGKAVKAYVHLKPGCVMDADEIIAHCKANMASYKKPTSVAFTQAPLPRTAMGKISKKTLIETLEP